MVITVPGLMVAVIIVITMVVNGRGSFQIDHCGCDETSDYPP